MNRLKLWYASFLLRNTAFQYPYHVVIGIVKSLLNTFKTRKISSTKSNVLFIIGSGRSGNTLLRRLIVEHLSIYIPPETYVLRAQLRSVLKNRSLDWFELVDMVIAKLEYHPSFATFEINSLAEYAVEAKKLPKDKQCLGDLIYGLYTWLGNKKDIEFDWIGDKTPLNTLGLGMIAKLFPHAKYIYLERDGADVVDSYVKAGIYGDYTSAAARWIDSKKAWFNFKKSLHCNNYLEIQYEEFVKTPEHYICEISNTFVINKRPVVTSMTNQLGDVGAFAHHSNVNNRPNQSSIGKGRSELLKLGDDSLFSYLNPELKDSGYQELK